MPKTTVALISLLMKRKRDYPEVFRDLASFSAFVCMTFGAIVVLGWYLDNPVMKGQVQASGLNVKTNAGIASFFCGLSLLLQVRDRGLLAARTAAVGALLLGAFTLSEHLLNIDLGIDQLIFAEPHGAAATVSPNRMGPPASFCFSLAGASLLLLSGRTRALQEAAAQISVLFGLISMVPLVGYFLGVEKLYGIARYTGIALPTSIVFLILAAGVIGASPQSRLATLLSSPDAGGILLRRVLPSALLLPPLLGLLLKACERAGFFEASFSQALLIVLLVLFFSRLICTSAAALEKMDQSRMDLLESERYARSQAERASKLKDEFLATVSHELRTPLNAILGWTQLLKQKQNLASDITVGLETIDRNARMQTQLIEDLLNMSRILSGKLRLNIQALNLKTVVASAIDSIRLAAQEKQIALEMNSASTGPQPMFVDGDYDRLQQVLSNLLSNAIKFTPAGGCVKVDIVEVHGKVQISVSDNGEGIHPDMLNQIFERFRQGDGSASRRHGGLGIGLSIVRELVELHGGTVSASSPGKNRGTTFVISLPLAAANETHNESRRERPYALYQHELKTDLKGITALVVDDQPDARSLIARLLEERNAEVILAESAADAIARFNERRPDIIISDIGMPAQDGYEMVKAIRRISPKQGERIPAVALTAFTRDNDRENALRAGYDAHLSKPFDANELAALVRRLIKEKVFETQQRRSAA